MKKLGIALGGGGAKGLCQLAFLEVLDELQIRPSIISGTSIGAIIGGFYASGLSVQDIATIADTIDFNAFSPTPLPEVSVTSSAVENCGLKIYLIISFADNFSTSSAPIIFSSITLFFTFSVSIPPPSSSITKDKLSSTFFIEKEIL